MRVVVYVEGPSDVLALSALLQSLLEEKGSRGVAIEFFQAPSGDRKESVLLKVPLRAVNIILNDPGTMVVALPDLYPKNKGFPHETCEELRSGVMSRFEEELARKGVCDDRLTARFKVFCLKHDLEALLLASGPALESRLGTASLPVTWSVPVEDQNQDDPPKRLIERLFADHHSKYKDTVDAPLILSSCNYKHIAERCPQCFKPFVDFLDAL